MDKEQAAELKAWNAPQIRTIHPARRTQGGSSAVDDQDTIWHTAS